MFALLRTSWWYRGFSPTLLWADSSNPAGIQLPLATSSVLSAEIRNALHAMPLADRVRLLTAHKVDLGEAKR